MPDIVSETTLTLDSLNMLVKESCGLVISPQDFVRIREQGAPVAADGSFHVGELAAWLTARELDNL